MSSIFIQISSYRDKELRPTIIDAIERSSGKHQLYFGIHVCYLNESEIDVPDIKNIKWIASKAPENIGVGIGRYIAHQFYNDEDYYFQCDSHMRFVQDWDEIAVNSILNYQTHGIEKPLLTMYPANYFYKDESFQEITRVTINSDYRTTISFHKDPEEFKKSRIPSQTAMPLKEGIFTRSISAGSVFTVGPFIEPNKDMAFWGEEIMMAARAYTHGYDLVVPSTQYLYHLYFNQKNIKINRREHVWIDFPKEYEISNIKSRAIVYKTLVEGTVGDGYLGSSRTIEEYGVFAGLDFLNGNVIENC
jgi:hypothetical protein